MADTDNTFYVRCVKNPSSANGNGKNSHTCKVLKPEEIAEVCNNIMVSGESGEDGRIYPLDVTASE